MSWKRRLAVLVLATLAVAILAETARMIPVPFGDARKHMPKVAAIDKYPNWGCGLHGSSSSSTTVFYPKLKADRKLRDAIREEMLSQQYAEKISESSTSYVKSSDGVFPYRSYVAVMKDDTVVKGVSRSKWPKFR